MNNKTLLYTLLIVLVIAGGGMLFSTTGGQSDCVFTENNKQCQINVTVPSGQTVEQLRLKLSPSPRTSAFSEPISVEPYDTISARDIDRDDDEVEYNTMYLVRSPEPLSDVAGVRIGATAEHSSRVGSDRDSYAFSSIRSIGMWNVPNLRGGVGLCYEDEDEDCGFIRNKDLVYGAWNRNRDLWSIRNEIRFSEVEEIGEGASLTEETTQKITSEYFGDFFSRDENIFYVFIRHLERDRGASASHELTGVEMSYSRNVYPSNLKYRVGNTELSENRVVDSELRSIDLSSETSKICEDNKEEDCTATITLVSDTIGELDVDAETVLRQAVYDSDNDGFTDEEDECPQTTGDLRGCPPQDADGDGTFDRNDACPQTYGLRSDGCERFFLIRWLDSAYSWVTSLF